jgi:hypothetical protein
MNSTARIQYMEAIRKVHAASELRYPSLYQLQALCPHLSPALLKNLSPGSFIAMPPVLVNDSIQIGYVGLGARRSALISSFRMPPVNSGDKGKYLYVEEALRYARKHWPKQLIQSSWDIAQTVYLQSPVRSNGVLQTSRTIWVGLRSGGNPDMFLFNKLEKWNDIIAIATLDPIEGSEIEDNHGSFHAFNCARCGGGLDIEQCFACLRGHAKDPHTSNLSWRSSLPPKLRALLQEHGHVFGSEVPNPQEVDTRPKPTATPMPLDHFRSPTLRRKFL